MTRAPFPLRVPHPCVLCKGGRLCCLHYLVCHDGWPAINDACAISAEGAPSLRPLQGWAAMLPALSCLPCHTALHNSDVFPQVYVIGTPSEQLPFSRPDFPRFPFAQRFWCRYFGTRPTPSIQASCRPSTIALRWFSEFSEISTVFR